MDLMSYLDRLDESRRSTVVTLLARLPEPDRLELTEYLSGLGGRIRAEERLKETYLFAPSRWPRRVLRETASRSARPALRHLIPARPENRPITVFVSREFSGISDMWVIRLPRGSHGTIETTGGVAIVPLAGTSLMVNGVPTSTVEPTVLDRGQPKEIRAGEDALALVVASPALVDARPDGSWLITSAASTTAPKPLALTGS